MTSRWQCHRHSVVSRRQAACRRRQTEENQTNVAAADVNTEEAHENDKRKWIFVQIYLHELVYFNDYYCCLYCSVGGGSSSSSSGCKITTARAHRSTQKAVSINTKGIKCRIAPTSSARQISGLILTLLGWLSISQTWPINDKHSFLTNSIIIWLPSFNHSRALVGLILPYIKNYPNEVLSILGNKKSICKQHLTKYALQKPALKRTPPVFSCFSSFTRSSEWKLQF